MINSVEQIKNISKNIVRRYVPPTSIGGWNRFTFQIFSFDKSIENNVSVSPASLKCAEARKIFYKRRIFFQRCVVNNFRGSITMEASIIVPLVVLCITAAIYMGLLLYQRSLIQSAAVAAAEAGAAAWPSGTFELDNSKPDMDSENYQLYRRIFDSGSARRLEEIEKYALSLSSRNDITAPIRTEAEAVVKDYAVYRKLEVSITKYYSMPLGKMVRIFGGSDNITINVKAVSTINEPVELIRSTDLIIDIEKRLEEKFPALKDLGDKTRDKMNELKGKLVEFVD